MIDKEKFAELWGKGLTGPQIAQIMGEKVNTLYQYALRAKFPKHSVGRKSILADPEKKRWFMLNYPEMSNRTLAVYLGVSANYVMRLASRLGLRKSETYYASVREYTSYRPTKFSQSKQN